MQQDQAKSPIPPFVVGTNTLAYRVITGEAGVTLVPVQYPQDCEEYEKYDDLRERLTSASMTPRGDCLPRRTSRPRCA